MSGAHGLGRAAMALALGSGLGLLAASASSAQSRPEGAVYYQCVSQVLFATPASLRGAPAWKYPRDPKRPVQPWPADKETEQVQAVATVEADGAISSVLIDWAQAGTGSWPSLARADLDDVTLRVRLGASGTPRGRLRSPDPRAPFDPDRLSVEVSVLDRNKIKRPRVITLTGWRPGAYWEYSRLESLAYVTPVQPRAATVYVGWEELRRLGGDQAKLSYWVEEPVFRKGAFDHQRVGEGTLDLSVMPLVIEAFRKADAEVRAKTADPRAQCRAEVELPLPIEAITTVGARP